MKYLAYNPEQAYLLPPSVAEVLGEDHLCFFVHRAVDRLNLSQFEQQDSEDGRPGYHPALMLKVWLYAYALGITAARRLEQRIQEDLPLRYLAGGAAPDFWTLNAFRAEHARAINDVFTQVVELARAAGLARLGHVAIDSTRIAANAARDRIDREKTLRAERAKIRRQIRCWHKQCDAVQDQEAAGQRIAPEKMAVLEQKLQEIPQRLERLRKEGRQQVSRTDPESRFLKDKKGFTLGYTATVAVSQDHLILEQRVTQAPADNAALVPVTEAVEQRCGERPQKVSADCGFFKLDAIVKLAQRGIDAYVPDPPLAREINVGKRSTTKVPVRHPEHYRMRQKLRDPTGREVYRKRQAIVEPIFGILKQQRGMRQFRRRGLEKVAVEFALATIGFNLTRMWRLKAALK